MKYNLGILLGFFLFNTHAYSFEPIAPSDSIYQLNQEWTNHDNKKVKLSELKGHPAVITMTYASCPGACPLMVADMKQLDSRLSKKIKNKMRYYTFSIDPDHDTPDSLKKFFSKMKLNERWSLMTSNAEQARELSAVLGFSYRDLGDGDFSHSTTLYLISSDGVILSKKNRDNNWDEFVEKIKKTP